MPNSRDLLIRHLGPIQKGSMIFASVDPAGQDGVDDLREAMDRALEGTEGVGLVVSNFDMNVEVLDLEQLILLRNEINLHIQEMNGTEEGGYADPVTLLRECAHRLSHDPFDSEEVMLQLQDVGGAWMVRFVNADGETPPGATAQFTFHVDTLQEAARVVKASVDVHEKFLQNLRPADGHGHEHHE